MTPQYRLVFVATGNLGAWGGISGILAFLAIIGTVFFVPMPKGGHGVEAFDVNGVRFDYSEFESGCYFHKTGTFGGPIREGLQVRIRHYDGRIMKLEIAG